jgi:hypothetical protein
MNFTRKAVDLLSLLLRLPRRPNDIISQPFGFIYMLVL